MGEVEHEALIRALARKSSRSSALTPLLVAKCFPALIGGLLLVLSEGSMHWAFWAALGILLAAVIFTLYGTLFIVRLFRRASQIVEASTI
jgi:hypothetical protein